MDLESKTITFSRESIQYLQERADKFLKLDLAYLVAAGAVVAYFKLDIDGLAESTDFALIFLVYYMVMAVIDAQVSSALCKYWFAAQTPRRERATIPRTFLSLIRRQVQIHVVFFLLIMAFCLGVGQSRYKQNVRLEAISQLQIYVNLFIARTGHSPTKLEEVEHAIPAARRPIDLIGEQSMRYRKDGDKTYIISIARRGELVGSENDMSLTPDVKFDEIISHIKGKS